MQRSVFGCALLGALALFGGEALAATAFPRKPVTIIVYTRPGGLIDTTARKFTAIAGKYTDATFVVENKPGAGGVLTIRQVLQRKADGYTLFACTKSNIAKLVATGESGYIEALDWLTMLMADPECIITRSGSATGSWETLRQDALARAGDQIWVGPATAGLDHIMALKVWEAAGISAQWVPFKSGGQAVAALLGGQGVAYVGNPRDTKGNPALRIVAVSASQRLPPFPDVPTFGELGLAGLDAEYMWRGFAVKKGTPPAALNWYRDLFARVAADPEWRGFWEKSGIDIASHEPEAFREIIARDREDFSVRLSQAGLMQESEARPLSALSHGTGFAGILAAILIAGIAIFCTVRQRNRGAAEALVIPLTLIFMAAAFLLLTFGFPTGKGVGPAVVPRLWMLLLIPLCVWVSILSAGNRAAEPGATGGRKVLVFVMMLFLYVVALAWIGYFISTLVFLPVAMTRLGYRRTGVTALVSIGWLSFCYVLFSRILHVPLPVGRLVEAMLP